jgi:hypothetical protein
MFILLAQNEPKRQPITCPPEADTTRCSQNNQALRNSRSFCLAGVLKQSSRFSGYSSAARQCKMAATPKKSPQYFIYIQHFGEANQALI